MKIQQVDNGSGGSEMKDRVFVGKMSHLNNVEIRLQFLELLIFSMKYKQEFNIEHIKRLWRLLVLENPTPLEKRVFLEWLQKNKELSKKDGKCHYYSMLSTDLLKEIIE